MPESGAHQMMFLQVSEGRPEISGPAAGRGASGCLWHLTAECGPEQYHATAGHNGIPGKYWL